MFLDELDAGLLEQVVIRGEQLKAGLLQLQRDLPVVKSVRGRGLMLGLQLDRPAAEVQQALHHNGLLINCTASDVLRIVPPFVITADQVAIGLQRLREALVALPPLSL